MRKPKFNYDAMLAGLTQCPTCTRSKYDPFRQYDERGKVIAGCIDDYHTGHLTPISESNAWHSRKSAKQHRAANKGHLRTLKPYADK